MNVNLAEFFKDFCSEIPPSVGSGEIYKLTYSDNLGNMDFYVNFSSIVPYKDILDFETLAADSIKIDRLRLNPRYDGSLFSLDCLGDLILRLKRDVSLVNGFLDDAE